jgi:polyadenylate-binding protein
LNKFEKEKAHQRTTLFIRNYPENFTQEQFEQLFGPFGKIKNILIKTGYTLVGYELMSQAAQARERFNNETINGKTLQVKFYESKLMK